MATHVPSLNGCDPTLSSSQDQLELWLFVIFLLLYNPWMVRCFVLHLGENSVLTRGEIKLCDEYTGVRVVQEAEEPFSSQKVATSILTPHQVSKCP